MSALSIPDVGYPVTVYNECWICWCGDLLNITIRSKHFHMFDHVGDLSVLCKPKDVKLNSLFSSICYMVKLDD